MKDSLVSMLKTVFENTTKPLAVLLLVVLVGGLLIVSTLTKLAGRVLEFLADWVGKLSGAAEDRMNKWIDDLTL